MLEGRVKHIKYVAAQGDVSISSSRNAPSLSSKFRCCRALSQAHAQARAHVDILAWHGDKFFPFRTGRSMVAQEQDGISPPFLLCTTNNDPHVLLVLLCCDVDVEPAEVVVNYPLI